MDAMEIAATRHGCKLCGKSFPCGRSLGGHMRSHLSLGEATAEADTDDELKHDSVNFGRSSNGVVGYGLREKPRKTRWLSDFADDEEEDDAGDDDRDGEHKACRQCGKLFGSWRSLFGHMRSHASGGRDRDQEDADMEEEFVPEDAEPKEVAMVELMDAPVLAQAPVVVLTAEPRRRRRTMRVAAPAPAPPPVLSGYEKEQEDVALCLLMLSRDTGLWSLPAKEEPFEKENDHRNAMKKARHARNGYAYNSDEYSALLQYGNAKIKRGSVAKSRNRSSPKQQCQVAAATKRTRYECPGCGKVFSSYQALGGHRASHKRINASCSDPKAASVPALEPSAETYTSFSTLPPSASPDSVSVAISIGGEKVSGRDKASVAAEAVVEKFECPICFKVFVSEQALGGHKRSHLLAVIDDGDLYDAGADQEQHTPAAAEFLDLNFPPAPAEA